MQKYLFLPMYVGISVQLMAIAAVDCSQPQRRRRLVVVHSTLFLDGGGDGARPRVGPGDGVFA